MELGVNVVLHFFYYWLACVVRQVHVVEKIGKWLVGVICIYSQAVYDGYSMIQKQCGIKASDVSLVRYENRIVHLGQSIL